jgi:hypothetical protein
MNTLFFILAIVIAYTLYKLFSSKPSINVIEARIRSHNRSYDDGVNHYYDLTEKQIEVIELIGMEFYPTETQCL